MNDDCISDWRYLELERYLGCFRGILLEMWCILKGKMRCLDAYLLYYFTSRKARHSKIL